MPWEGVYAARRGVAWCGGLFQAALGKKATAGREGLVPSSSCDSRALLGGGWRPACHPPTLNEYLLESSRTRSRR